MPVPKIVKRVVPWRIRHAIRQAQARRRMAEVPSPVPSVLRPPTESRQPLGDPTSAATRTWDHKHGDDVRSAWTENPYVFMATNRRQSGDPHRFWLDWLFEDHVKTPVARVLSIGCGAGEHERLIAERGFAERIDAFDVSPVGIRRAREEAERAGLTSLHFEERGFEDFIARGPDEPLYDVVVFAGSLHHVLDLEGMLSRVRRVLKKDGVILYNEYVGPCYTIVSDERAALVNRFIDALPKEFKRTPTARFMNPSIEQVMADDPSEGVRASLIPGMLRLYFDVEIERRSGGGLLHPLFPQLDTERLGSRSPESEAIVSLLIAIEDILTETGVLENDFIVGLCRHKRR